MPPPLELRPYQAYCKQAIYGALREHRRVLLQLATGGGKTIILADIARDAVANSRSVIILVHRQELVDQTVDKLVNAGIRPAVIASGYYPRNADVYVAMVQTLARRTPPRTDLVIIDEAHHATARTYQTIVENMPHAKIVGVTATPARLDGKGLADAFDILVCGPTMQELIELGHLVPCEVYGTQAPPITVRKKGGDYDQRELALVMEKTVLHGDLVDTYLSLAAGKRTIVFAASVWLSQRYCEEYREAGIPAAHIDGTTPAGERNRIVQAFRDGRLKVLCNYGLITEGFDVPACEAVQLVRPTQSLPLYLQMVGRAMRPAPGKSSALILDHAQCVKRHGFPEEEREWVLEGRQKRSVKLPELVEVDIDLGPNPERRPPEHLKTVQLQRLTPQTAQTAEDLARALKAQAESEGYKTGWVLHRWKEHIPSPSEKDYKAFARVMGYHHGWVKHQIGGQRA